MDAGNPVIKMMLRELDEALNGPSKKPESKVKVLDAETERRRIILVGGGKIPPECFDKELIDLFFERMGEREKSALENGGPNLRKIPQPQDPPEVVVPGSPEDRAMMERLAKMPLVQMPNFG